MMITFLNIRIYIFRRDNLLELLERELGLALAHVVPEHLLEPLDVLLGQGPVLAEGGAHQVTHCHYNANKDSHFARQADEESHELLHSVDCILIFVDASQQSRQHSSRNPNLEIVLNKNIIAFMLDFAFFRLVY